MPYAVGPDGVLRFSDSDLSSQPAPPGTPPSMHYSFPHSPYPAYPGQGPVPRANSPYLSYMPPQPPPPFPGQPPSQYTAFPQQRPPFIPHPFVPYAPPPLPLAPTAPSYSPTAPSYSPPSPTHVQTRLNSPSAPSYSPVSPSYAPSHSSTSTSFSPPSPPTYSPTYSPTSPTYSQTAPAFSPPSPPSFAPPPPLHAPHPFLPSFLRGPTSGAPPSRPVAPEQSSPAPANRPQPSPPNPPPLPQAIQRADTWSTASTRDARFEHLHNKILEAARTLSPRPQERSLRSWTIQRLRQILKQKRPFSNSQTTLTVFGSELSGLYLPTGDIDMSLRCPTSNLKPADLLRVFVELVASSESNRFMQDGSIDYSGLNARVPVVRFRTRLGGIKIDVSANNESGVPSSELVQSWSTRYAPNFYPLALIFKHWLSESKRSEVFTGGIGGYAAANMVLSVILANPELDKRKDSLGSVIPA
ncbi:hypothetical protein BDK51DRAFT_48355 [Blyttiomyces helicus]|uniref:Poly(A) RNA polymerase mitochondrial-like central palm domain-containing protein n=1 Tax=Blyttiomyces helicus TaxID=388810 RepID=A0A4P9WA37_9FUNG|nr:hypothetical protein BDK51DRAFT_48355 [Blyttiomyces helicus]|eukprot:RKO87096.1 hypothetical protein BDK51DRAFT_48355 [Blyttiomyces helicus]